LVFGAVGGKKDPMRARVELESRQTRSTEQFSHPNQFEYPIAATLTRNDVRACIEDTGVIPSLNVESTEDAQFIADTLLEAGIPIVEISMHSPYALQVVSHLINHAPTTIVGAGSIRNIDTARKCAEAGAKFLATDGTAPGVVEFALSQNLTMIAGALTFSEVMAAWDSGSDFVKVVPCYSVGGPKYIHTLKAAVPQARLIAAGGVNQLTALNYVAAGAMALEVGQELLPAEAIAMRQSRRIQELARRFLTAVDTGRI
jgi:2-dehydro-3-deoxyphosphogluconate aldolase / (4S)-4-hydroxy-2-oxoglutarate aldolase